MGNPAYDARREAERAQADTERAMSEAMKEGLECFIDWLRGRAHIEITQPLGSLSNARHVRLVRDVNQSR